MTGISEKHFEISAKNEINCLIFWDNGDKITVYLIRWAPESGRLFHK